MALSALRPINTTPSLPTPSTPAPLSPPPPHYALFCQVIDNLGDIGVCWRLARQLADEWHINVALWVDDLARFQWLEPRINPSLPAQTLAGVQVFHWSADQPQNLNATLHTWQTHPPRAVIEAFACNLPENIIQAMRGLDRQPVWINLEYLSAETWIEGCHRQASPQQGLSKSFFFPGFTKATGGLLREQDADHTFKRMPDHKRLPWIATQAQVPAAALPQDALLLSLFAYDNPALPALLEVWANHPTPVVLFIPVRALAALLPRLITYFATSDIQVGTTLQKGALTVVPMPMLSQPNYDTWLAQMDINFVRGEDSFVRAQWALMPWVWQIYPQAENAHDIKLKAFLQRYRVRLPADAAHALTQLWLLWNGLLPNPLQASTEDIWQQFYAHRQILAQHAHPWQAQLKAVGDLATNLVQFVQFREKNAKISTL